MTLRITADQVARLRLQGLWLLPDEGARRSPAEIVRHMLAMQGQHWSGSRLAIGMRDAELTDADVLAAYDRGEIVRSWPMRGTVHVVAAEDLPWMLSLMGERALVGVQRRWDALGIDEALLERAREIVVPAMRGGSRLTRAELLGLLGDGGLDVSGQRGYHTIWYLAQTGTLVWGPTRDREQQLVLLDEWIPEPRALTRAAALAELGVRYLRSRGPATVDDLAHWTKLTKRDCRTAIEANADVLVELDRAGEPMYMLRECWESLDAGSAAAGRVVLAVAPFDEHLLGYRSRSDVVDDERLELVVPGRNGMFRATIVARGRVAGVWTAKRRTLDRVVTVDLFDSVPKRGIERAFARYGRFVGTPVTVEVRSAAAG